MPQTKVRALKWVGISILSTVVVLTGTFFIAKTSDGPLGPFPGGPLVSGELAISAVTDWTFARETGEIELQLLQDSSSRTTWLAVANNSAYIPAALDFPPNKSWHLRAERDGDAQIRFDNTRYPVRLARLDETSAEFSDVVDVLVATNAMPPGGKDQMWLFRVSSR
ncbi:MAG: hypothetical protein GKR90_22405 [Pseudomonadales bacterium]|nr:hypothetical protein [Pseudomonadales bacterium]